MTYSLAGKRAIVTGAAGGIGRQTATQLAAAGAAVYINDIDADAIAEARTAIPGLAGEVTDMGDPAAIKTFFGRAVEHLGGLDILINNVGSAGPTGPVCLGDIYSLAKPGVSVGAQNVRGFGTGFLAACRFRARRRSAGARGAGRGGPNVIYG